MNDITPCPCGSGRAYAECCEPFISGASKPSTPEALMRSRYSAYALEIMPYLASTLHPSQRHDYDEEGAARWAKESDWDKLEIIDVSDAANPVELGNIEVDLPSGADDLEIDGNLAYVTSFLSGVRIIDGYEPAAPSFASPA